MPTYNFGGSGDEVSVDPTEPTNEEILLWVDTDENPDPYGDLKANGNITADTGWEIFGGSYPYAHATRVGDIIAVEGLFRCTTNLVVSTGINYRAATIPAGFRPIQGINAVGYMSFTGAGSALSACRIIAWPGGNLEFSVFTSGTFTANAGFVSWNMTYRVA